MRQQLLWASLLLLLLGCSDKIVEVRQDGRHFSDFTRTALYHDLRISEAKLEDAPLVSGCEIGVFTWRGVLSGAGVWNADSLTVIRVYGADDTAPNQFHSGDFFLIRIWDASTNTEYPAAITVTPQTGWSANGLSSIILRGYISSEIRVQLMPGWNLVSINVDPLVFHSRADGPDFRTMCSQMKAGDVWNLVLAKDERGRFYAPRIHDFCNIPFWEIETGYLFRVDSAMQVVWSGRAIPADEPIRLDAGWNIAAYYPTYPLSCDSISFRAISPIRDRVLQIKDEAGRFAKPQRGFSNMIPWHPGEAYQIRVSEAVTLHYPGPEAVTPVVPPEDGVLTIGPWLRPRGTGVNKSLLIESISGVTFGAGDGVAAISTSGQGVGLSPATGGKVGMAIWGDDPTTAEFEGLADREAYELWYWSAAMNREMLLEVTRVSEGDGLFYETDGYTAVTLGVR